MTDRRSDPDPYAEHPEDSVFPTAGERVSDEDRQRALDAEPHGNATVGDTVDTDGVDSRAHEDGPAHRRSRSRSTPTERLTSQSAMCTTASPEFTRGASVRPITMPSRLA